LPVANGGTGQTTYTNGQLLIGNTTGNTMTKATLTAGTGISVTNGTGTITIAATVTVTEANTSLAVGTNAGGTGIASGENTALGYGAMDAASGAGCLSNVAVGKDALGGASFSSASNTAIGRDSGSALSTGGGNTFVGSSAGNSVTTGTLNTFLGRYQGTAGMTSNVVLADGNFNRRFWHDATDAFVSHSTTASAANAHLDSGTNALKRSTSSLRYKRDVEPLEPDFADALLGLEPIFYRSKIATDRQDWSHYGFSAEQLAEIEPRFVQYIPHPDDWVSAENGDEKYPIENARLIPDGVAYDRMVVPLLSIVKRQQQAINDLVARVTALEGNG
jgi:hypothetical protein